VKITMAEALAYRQNAEVWVRQDRLSTFCSKLTALLDSKVAIDVIPHKLSGYFDVRGRPNGEQLREYIELLIREGCPIGLSWGAYAYPAVDIPPPKVTMKPKPAIDPDAAELYRVLERERDQERIAHAETKRQLQAAISERDDARRALAKAGRAEDRADDKHLERSLRKLIEMGDLDPIKLAVAMASKAAR